MTENVLYYGDNLDIMRRYLADESVDLEYLDPPFNSNATYNVLFAEHNGTKAAAQVKAFEDTWTWDEAAAREYQETVERGGQVSRALQAFRGLLGESSKPTGSIYLHCDPTASHYLKVLMDAAFGPVNFRNEITWKRTTSHNDARRNFSSLGDIILFYSKSDAYFFTPQYVPYDDDYVKRIYKYVDSDGRRYSSENLRSPHPRPNLTYDYKGYRPHQNGWTVSLEKMQELDRQGRLIFPSSPDGRIRVKKYLDEMPGVVLGNLWEDIQPISSHAAERLGYPTQKPEALLTRIIEASCPEGGTVLDPFAGCGTSVVAAQRSHRPWIGIDITHLAINLVKVRLRDTFGDSVHYKVVGEPVTVADAQDLADQDPYQFQWVGARTGGCATNGAKEGL